mgnify:CR=1 FL=1
MIAPKKEQSDHKTGIMQNQFDHSPPQTTLTQNKWIDTKKVGRDDAEIRRTKLAVEAERKRKRKKEKPVAHGTSVVEILEGLAEAEYFPPEHVAWLLEVVKKHLNKVGVDLSLYVFFANGF